MQRGSSQGSSQRAPESERAPRSERGLNVTPGRPSEWGRADEPFDDLIDKVLRARASLRTEC
jgi:hypothetical protein